MNHSCNTATTEKNTPAMVIKGKIERRNERVKCIYNCEFRWKEKKKDRTMCQLMVKWKKRKKNERNNLCSHYWTWPMRTAKPRKYFCFLLFRAYSRNQQWKSTHTHIYLFLSFDFWAYSALVTVKCNLYWRTFPMRVSLRHSYRTWTRETEICM